MPETKTILLVEDESIIALSESNILKKNGFGVIDAVNAEQAIALMKTNSIDLILMDVDLGKGMDGTQAAEVILSEYDVPVVFLSSHAEKEIVDKTGKIANYGFIVKNLGEPILIASIEMAFKLYDAHRKAKDSEKRYRLLFNSVNDSVFVHEPAGPNGLPGKFLEVNDAACQRLGYSREELLTMKVHEIDAPETISAIPEHALRVLDEETDFWEGAHVSKDGRRIPVEINNRLFELDGEPVVLSTVRDISERKESLTSLKKSEEMYRILFENAAEGILIYDKDMNVVNVNHQLCEIIGYDYSELAGKNIFSLGVLHPDDRRSAVEKIGPFFSGELPGKTRYPIIHKSGETIVCDLNSAIIRDESGEVASVITIVRDATEQTKAEEALKISEMNYREIFEASCDAVVVHDLNGRIIDVNKTMCAMFGYSHDEALKLNVSDISLGVYPYSQEEAGRLVKKAAEEGNQFFQWQCRRKNGELFWAEVSLKFATISGQKRVLAFDRDITERKRTEDMLRDTRHRLDSIVSNLYAGVMLVSENGIVELINQAYCDVFNLTETPAELRGLTSAEMMEKVVHAFVSPAETKARIKKIIAQGNPVRNEEFAMRNGGFSIVDYIPLVVDGRRHGRIWHHKDITAQKRAEKKIQNLLLEKELILKEVHHRIRNNMNTVFSLLTVQANEQKNRTVKSILLEAAGRVQSMGVLYEKLYRAEDTYAASIKEYLPALVDDIVGIFARRPSLTIDYRLDDVILGPGLLSPLGIIVNELVTNAIKYAFTDGEGGAMTIQALKSGDRVLFTFQDNGRGIPESVTLEHSPGLGLQLVEMLVEQMRGSITLERGRGTKFEIEFEA
jgi:PAS domain S-box-containing protein